MTTHIRRCCTRLITYHSPASKHPSIGYGEYHSGAGTEAQRVAYADTQTGYHDCRIALSIAMGAPLDRIAPSMGHSPGDWEPIVYEPVSPVGADGTYYLGEI